MIVVTGGGSGKVSNKNAMLHITAPDITTKVQLFCGDDLVSELTPDKAFRSNGSLFEWFYPVRKSLLGDWTIIANGPNGFSVTPQGTVAVTEATKYYHYNVVYRLYLYNNGSLCPNTTGGYSKVSSGVWKNDTDAEQMTMLAETGSRRYAATENKINILHFSKLVVFGYTRVNPQTASNYSAGFATERGIGYVENGILNLPNNTTAAAERTLSLESINKITYDDAQEVQPEYYFQFANASSSYPTVIKYAYVEV